MERCTMPKGNLQMCSRAARYRYVLRVDGTSANPDITVAAYCAQHARAGGHSAMLRPRPWEFDYVYDIAAAIVVEGRRV